MYQGNFQLIKSELLDPPLSEDELHDKCCMICADIATRPVLCTVCKSIYCLRCASMWKSGHNSCPKKCQSPWNFTMLDSLNLPLKCPYGEGECPKLIPETLVLHLQSCGRAPPDVKTTLERRRNYLCEKDHPLEFWVASFDEMVNAKCAECGQLTACRSKCAKCKLKYCVLCRPPPCSKTQCPKGHNYAKGRATESYVCDACGLRPCLFDQDCYDDIKCNFGLCESCHQKLPQVKMAHGKNNNYDQCDAGHSITFCKGSCTGECRNCEHETRLERECRLCDTRYCLQCKPLNIFREMKCFKKHKIEQVFNDELTCSNCRTEPQAFLDVECGFSLCYNCLEEMLSEARCRERISAIYCNSERQHLLRMVPNPQNQLHACSQCKNSRHCALACGECGQFYCVQCRPSHYRKQDYFGHDFAKEINNKKECFGCGQVSPFSFYCDLCSIALCPLCYKKS